MNLQARFCCRQIFIQRFINGLIWEVCYIGKCEKSLNSQEASKIGTEVENCLLKTGPGIKQVFRSVQHRHFRWKI